MRSTALAYQYEFDEVPVSSTEILEATLIALREELKEHKGLREKVDEIAADVSTIGSKLNALFWVMGGLVALAVLAKTLGWI